MGHDVGLRPADWLVLGGDVGGTTTRILLADQDGRPHGRGTAGGGNPISHPDTAVTALEEALHAALAGVDVTRVRAAVVGVAGGGAPDRPDAVDLFDRVWSSAGLRGVPAYVSDLEVAFVSGTVEPDGTVLIAGTGASVAAVRDRRTVRTADGHGWLLGDEGSGFWLGREAARLTLRTLDAAEPPGPLAAAVLHEVAAPASTPSGPDLAARRAHVIHTLNGRAPVRLSELAPLVTAAYQAGDPAATHIVEQAARLLTETIGRVRHAEEATPIVLAGSVVRPGSAVGDLLRTSIGQRSAGPVLPAADGVGGAAWLALAAADPDAATPESRTRLTTP